MLQKRFKVCCKSLDKLQKGWVENEVLLGHTMCSIWPVLAAFAQRMGKQGKSNIWWWVRCEKSRKTLRMKSSFWFGRMSAASYRVGGRWIKFGAFRQGEMDSWIYKFTDIAGSQWMLVLAGAVKMIQPLFVNRESLNSRKQQYLRGKSNREMIKRCWDILLSTPGKES